MSPRLPTIWRPFWPVSQLLHKVVHENNTGTNMKKSVIGLSNRANGAYGLEGKKINQDRTMTSPEKLVNNLDSRRARPTYVASHTIRGMVRKEVVRDEYMDERTALTKSFNALEGQCPIRQCHRVIMCRHYLEHCFILTCLSLIYPGYVEHSSLEYSLTKPFDI